MAVFASRQIVMPVLSGVVTITGSGDAKYCYATINGTKQYSAGTHEVNAGDTITFGVFGRNYTYYGSVTIDGTEVLRVMNSSTETYDWTVPDGIQTIAIDMSDISKPPDGTVYSEITVTTA